MSVENALEAVYTSLENDNKDIDACIVTLKSAMKDEGAKKVEIDNARLPVPNREGRNMLKSYFKKRGVLVSFKVAE